uniref:ZP domain-containing protein n=1 Tax=Timema douglasi TaxID=61478 RepID=A0A7R8VAZ7_TIMDO|nr:unnamed protein product [Timema douglasi]
MLDHKESVPSEIRELPPRQFTKMAEAWFSDVAKFVSQHLSLAGLLSLEAKEFENLWCRRPSVRSARRVGLEAAPGCAVSLQLYMGPRPQQALNSLSFYFREQNELQSDSHRKRLPYLTEKRLYHSRVQRGTFHCSLAVNQTQTTSKPHWQDKMNANSLKFRCSIPDMTNNCKVARLMPALEPSGSLKRNDGGVEYFNTIVVQPHLKLVTNQGRGFHIRCRYQTKNRTISNNMNIREVAENVKIGDPLTLVISIDEQAAYGLRVSDCLVRDGLGWGEQRLINDEGCPLDGEIMGQFEYNESKTKASVHFQAHKFPYTASVYYQCNTPDDPNSICISQRNFAIAIAVAGLILMLAVVAVIVILLA